MSAHKGFTHTSDFIILSIILTSLILEWYFPTNLYIDKTISVITGIVLLIIAWTIIFTAKYQFKKFNQKTGPNHETTLIISSGLFKYTRNPIYLGVIMLPLSFSLIINSLWLLVAIIPSTILIHYLLIVPEEKYLLNQFQGEYSNYCKKVGRWF